MTATCQVEVVAVVGGPVRAYHWYGCLTRVTSLPECVQQFGGAAPTQFTLTSTADGLQVAKTRPDDRDRLMFYALQMFYSNGGGLCYIVSVGHYAADYTRQRFQAGIDVLRAEDEPTLIVLTDAVNLPADDYLGLCRSTLFAPLAARARLSGAPVLWRATTASGDTSMSAGW